MEEAPAVAGSAAPRADAPPAPRRGRKRSAEGAGLGERPEDDAAVPAAAPGGGAPARDNYTTLFGRVDPRHIPESSGWWHSRQAELMAISDDHELGLMSGMVTSTQNDASPELLAHARRGPCAAPQEAEMYECC